MYFCSDSDSVELCCCCAVNLLRFSCCSVLGVLSVAKEASHGKFTTADEGMLMHFSDYAGLACITHKVRVHYVLWICRLSIVGLYTYATVV